MSDERRIAYCMEMKKVVRKDNNEIFPDHTLKLLLTYEQELKKKQQKQTPIDKIAGILSALILAFIVLSILLLGSVGVYKILTWIM